MMFYFFILQSSAPVELTEAETEYAVNVVKHIFDRHVVFQYNCTNTIPEQLLENVIIELETINSTFRTSTWDFLDDFFSMLLGHGYCGCFRSRGIR